MALGPGVYCAVAGPMPVDMAGLCECPPTIREIPGIPGTLTFVSDSFLGREPVTTEEAEDYFEVISQPMDFQTMQSKCSCGSYRSVLEFLSDIKQVFSNAEHYNQNGSHVLSCLEKTEQCLIDMLHKHLPGHTYSRRKRKKPSARHQGLEAQEGDSESEATEHSRGRKRKK